MVFTTSAPCQSRLNGFGLSYLSEEWFGTGMAIPVLYFGGECVGYYWYFVIICGTGWYGYQLLEWVFWGGLISCA